MEKKPVVPVAGPPARISQSTVLLVGSLIFVVALIWPPLILLVAYVLSIFIPTAYRINDDAVSRRIQFRKFMDQPDLPSDYVNIPDHIDFQDKYWVNSRGMCLSTTTMTPKNVEPKAVLCFCHGYTDNSSFMKRVEYQRFVNAGIAVVMIEYEGHGRSDGQLGYIENWDLLVEDVDSFFEETMRTRFPNKPCFLMGESMGGAVCYSAYKRRPSQYRGVLFNAPMCKVADNMMPPSHVVKAFHYILEKFPFLSRLPLAPSRGDLKSLSHHVPEKAELVRMAPSTFDRKPRLATARELLNVTSNISDSLHDFDAPFLVQHGLNDKVTDPQLSQSLYDESKSEDKTILLYKGMWHSLTSGEPDDSVDLVFKDAIEWVLARL